MERVEVGGEHSSWRPCMHLPQRWGLQTCVTVLILAYIKYTEQKQGAAISFTKYKQSHDHSCHGLIQYYQTIPFTYTNFLFTEQCLNPVATLRQSYFSRYKLWCANTLLRYSNLCSQLRCHKRWKSSSMLIREKFPFPNNSTNNAKSYWIKFFSLQLTFMTLSV